MITLNHNVAVDFLPVQAHPHTLHNIFYVSSEGMSFINNKHRRSLGI